MFILKSIFGSESEKQEIKPQIEQSNLLPGTILDIHKRKYYIEGEHEVIKNQITRLERNIEDLTKTTKDLTSNSNMIEAKKTVDKLITTKKNLELMRLKDKNCKVEKTNIEIELMEAMLGYEAQKADNFLNGMQKIDQKMSTMDAKQVASSLEDTNKLIKTLSAKREEQQLFEFYSNINTQDLEKKNKEEQPNTGSVNEGTNSIYASTVRKNTHQEMPITPIEYIKRPFSLHEKEFIVPFQRSGFNKLVSSEQLSGRALNIPKPSSADNMEISHKRLD